MRTFVLLLLAALLVPRGAWAGALVIDVSGPVESGGKPLCILDRVQDRDLLTVAEGAAATLVFLGGGAEVELAGPCQVKVGLRDVALLSGAPGAVTRRLPQARGGVPLPEGTNISVGAFIRRVDRFQLLSDPTLADATPELRWIPLERYDQIVLTLRIQPSQARVLEVTLPGSATSWTVPQEHPLEFGREYLLELIGLQGFTPRECEVKLEVLQAAQVQHLEEAERYFGSRLEEDPRSVPAVSSLLALYLHYRLYTPALEMAGRALALRPSDKNLKRIRAKLERGVPGNSGRA